MRTDHRSEREDTVRAPLSRRTFLLVGGSAVGTAVSGTASGSTGGRSQFVEVAATAPYFPMVRNAVEADERTMVTLRHGDASDDAVDVAISGRPTQSDGAVRDVTIDGWAAVAHADGEWRDCLRRSDVRDRWASETPVETWSETSWESIYGATLNNVTPAAGGSDATPSVLVRGTRAYQYAQGHGGVGYYGVDRDALEEASADLDESGHTPIVRLGYVHVDRAALSDRRVTAFLQHYSRHTSDVGNAVTCFVDPTVER